MDLAKTCTYPDDVFFDELPKVDQVRQELIDSLTKVLPQVKNTLLEASKKAQDILNQINQDSKESSEKVIMFVKKYLSQTGATQSWIDKVEEEGKQRYGKKLGPGYSDKYDKNEITRDFGRLRYHTKYGDLLIWQEVLDFIKSKPDLKNVIFITNDGKTEKKTDLYWNGDTTKGPAPFLVGEVQDVNGDSLIICPISEVMKTFDLGANYLSLRTNNQNGVSRLNLEVAEQLESAILGSSEIKKEIEDSLESNLPDLGKYFDDQGGYGADVYINPPDIDRVEVNKAEFVDLAMTTFSADIYLNFSVSISATNPMYEPNVNDDTSQFLEDDKEYSVYVSLNGAYDASNEEFVDINVDIDQENFDATDNDSVVTLF